MQNIKCEFWVLNCLLSLPLPPDSSGTIFTDITVFCVSVSVKKRHQRALQLTKTRRYDCGMKV